MHTHENSHPTVTAFDVGRKMGGEKCPLIEVMVEQWLIGLAFIYSIGYQRIHCSAVLHSCGKLGPVSLLFQRCLEVCYCRLLKHVYYALTIYHMYYYSRAENKTLYLLFSSSFFVGAIFAGNVSFERLMDAKLVVHCQSSIYTYTSDGPRAMDWNRLCTAFQIILCTVDLNADAMMCARPWSILVLLEVLYSLLWSKSIPFNVWDSLKIAYSYIHSALALQPLCTIHTFEWMGEKNGK